MEINTGMHKINTYWNKCQEYLHANIPAPLYKRLIEPLELDQSDSQKSFSKQNANILHIKLIAPNKQIASRVSQRYLPLINKFFNHNTPIQAQASLLTKNRNLVANPNNVPKAIPINPLTSINSWEHNSPSPTQQQSDNIPNKTNSTNDLQLQNFHINKANLYQLNKLWERKVKLSYLYGDAGSGKSTLSQALGEHQEKQGLRVQYMSFQTFLTGLVKATHGKNSTNWRQRLNTHDCIIIDDFQYIKPKAMRSQEELVYLIDEFLNNNKQIIFCSNCLPNRLKLTSHLLSRLQSGQLIQLKQPGQKERESILQQESQDYRLPLSLEAITHISRCIPQDMRRLKTSISRLYEYHLAHVQSLEQMAKIPIIEIDKICQDLYTYERQIKPQAVLNTVANFYGVQVSAIQGPARDKKYSLARHLVAYLSTKHLQLSLKETATLIGRRDHASAIHGRNRIARLMQNDLFLQSQVQEILYKLQNEY